MSFLNKVFREILKIKPFFQSLGRFRLGVGVSFSADTPVTGTLYHMIGNDVEDSYVVIKDGGYYKPSRKAVEDRWVCWFWCNTTE